MGLCTMKSFTIIQNQLVIIQPKHHRLQTGISYTFMHIEYREHTQVGMDNVTLATSTFKIHITIYVWIWVHNRMKVPMLCGQSNVHSNSQNTTYDRSYWVWNITHVLAFLVCVRVCVYIYIAWYGGCGGLVCVCESVYMCAYVRVHVGASGRVAFRLKVSPVKIRILYCFIVQWSATHTHTPQHTWFCIWE